MHARTPLLALAALFAAALLAACGNPTSGTGGGSSSGGSGGSGGGQGGTGGGQGGTGGATGGAGGGQGGTGGATGGAGGGQGGAGGIGGEGGAIVADGSCAAPLTLREGANVGTTAGGVDHLTPTCVAEAATGASDLVYALTVTEPTRLAASLVNDATVHDTILYVRAACADQTEDLACNDDAPAGRPRSAIQAELTPGTWFVVVDGYSPDEGAFQLDVTLTTVLTEGAACDPASTDPVCGAGLACREGVCQTQGGDSCAVPRALLFGATDVIDTNAFQDDAQAPESCAQNPTSPAPDAVFTFTLTERSDVVVSTDLPETTVADTILYARTTCDDETSSFACNDDVSGRNPKSRLALENLAPGTYFVFVDGFATNDVGPIAVTAERFTLRLAGESCDPALTTERCARGTTCIEGSCQALAGETCETAIPLVPGSNADDLTRRQDDFGPACSDTTGPDALFTFTLTEQSDVSLTIPAGGATFAELWLSGSCGDVATSLACGAANFGAPASIFVASLPAGTYFVHVDALSVRRASSYTLEFTATPVPAPGAVCTGVGFRCANGETCVDDGSGAGTFACAPLSAAAGELWVAFPDTTTEPSTIVIEQLDTASGAPLNTELRLDPAIVTGSGYCGLAHDGAELFFTDSLYSVFGMGGTDEIFVLDPATGAELRRLPSPAPGQLLALGLGVDETNLYATYTDQQAILLFVIDKLDGTVVREATISSQVGFAIDFGASSLFGADEGVVAAISSLSGALSRSDVLPATVFHPGGLAALDGRLYVADEAGGLTVLDDQGFSFQSLLTGPAPYLCGAAGFTTRP